MTKKELLAKIKALGDMNITQKKNIVCSLIGHSNIQDTFFGYYNCSRCGQQVGDSLGSIYDPSNIVIVGHNCETCKKNYKKLTWKDKYLAPNPFKKARKEWEVK